jgi:hypothetical protein
MISMFRVEVLLLVVGLIGSLSACSDTCESVQDELERIGRSIQKDPKKARESTEEIKALTSKLLEMDCSR